MGHSLSHILLLLSLLNTYLESKRDDQVREKITDKDKKKKVANKKDTANRGLKYMNPSQRNHSSIYE